MHLRKCPPLLLVAALCCFWAQAALAQKTQDELRTAIKGYAAKGVPGKSKDKKLHQEAQTAYEEYLKSFPEATDAYEARFGYAQILYRQGELGDASKWEHAAANYKLVIEADPKGVHLVDAALGLFVVAQKLMDALPAAPPLTPAATQVIELYQWLFRAAQKSLPKDETNDEVAGQCAYYAGSILLRYEKKEEALTWFQTGVEQYPATKIASSSASQVLLILFQEEKTKELKAYLERCKTDPKLAQDKSFQETLLLLEQQLSRKECDDAFTKEDWAAAAPCYQALGERSKDASKSDTLYNAAVSFERARQPEKALSLYEQLAKEPSEIGKKALSRHGILLLQLLYFEEAISPLEKLGQKHPEEKNAPIALQNAALLRAAFDQYDLAAENLKRYAELSTKRGDRTEAAEAAFEIALLREKQGDSAKTKAAFEQYLKTHTKSGSLEMSGYAHSALAALLWEQKKYAEAQKQCKASLALFEGQLEKGATLTYPEAAARCAFYRAELEYQKLQALTPPKAYEPTALQTWLTEAYKQQESAVAAYNQVKEFGATTWALASLYRGGQMFLFMVKQMEGIPQPDVILIDGQKTKLTPAQQEEYRKKIQEQIEPLSAPLRKQAIVALSACIEGAALLQDPSMWLAPCEELLSTLDPIAHPKPSEWIPELAEPSMVIAPGLVQKP